MSDEPRKVPRVWLLLAVLLTLVLARGGDLLDIARGRTDEPVPPPKPPAQALDLAPLLASDFRVSLQAGQEVVKDWTRRDSEWGVRSPLYYLYQAHWLRLKIAQFLKVPGLEPATSLEGMRIAELGPGSSLAVGVLAAMAGASHYDGLEVESYGWVRDAVFYDTMLSLASSDPFFSRRAKTEVLTTPKPGTVDFVPERITFNPDCPAEKMGTGSCAIPAGSVHVVYSYMVLEHIADLEQAIHRMRDVMAPGGIAVHSATFFDHEPIERHLRQDGGPLMQYGHLMVPPEQFASQVKCGGQHCKYKLANQLRPVDAKRLFEKDGFEVVYYVTVPDTKYEYDRNQTRFPADWDTIDDADWAKIDERIKKDHTRKEVGEWFITIVARKK